MQAYTIYCTGDSLLNRLFCNLFHLTVKSETVPTHTDIVLSSEPFLPYLSEVSIFWVSPYSLTSFPISCYLPSSPSFLFSATAVCVAPPSWLVLEKSLLSSIPFSPVTIGHPMGAPNPIHWCSLSKSSPFLLFPFLPVLKRYHSGLILVWTLKFRLDLSTDSSACNKVKSTTWL